MRGTRHASRGRVWFVLALLAPLSVACGREPTPRAPATPPPSETGAARQAASPDSLPGAQAAAAATPVAADRATAISDTIAPLAPPGVPAREFPKPDRPVASITTDTWSNEDARDENREAERAMALLGVGEGMAVADIGAGSGYYTVRLARAVGPAGRVFAQDIMREYLEKLRLRVNREGLTNVSLVLGDPHDPRLPEGSVDLALLVHMYHEIEQPYGLMHNLARSLRPGARVAVIDLDRATSRHGTPADLLRCELEVVGYRRVATHDLGKSGYLAVFEPPAGSAEVPAPESIRACAA